MIGRQDAMAGHEHGDWIRATRPSDRADGLQVPNCLSYLCITAGLAGSDIAQDPPHPTLKLRARGAIERRQGFRFLTLERAGQSRGRGGVPLVNVRRQRDRRRSGLWPLPKGRKIQTAQALLGIMRDEFAVRRCDG